MHSIGNKEIFARNLARCLQRTGKTQKEVADAVDVAPSTVHAWLQGSRYPRIDKIEMLADLFGMRKSDLIEENPFDPALIPGLLPLQVRKLPLLGDIACGEPLLAEEHIEIFVAAGDDLLCANIVLAQGCDGAVGNVIVRNTGDEIRGDTKVRQGNAYIGLCTGVVHFHGVRLDEFSVVYRVKGDEQIAEAYKFFHRAPHFLTTCSAKPPISSRM